MAVKSFRARANMGRSARRRAIRANCSAADAHAGVARLERPTAPPGDRGSRGGRGSAQAAIVAAPCRTTRQPAPRPARSPDDHSPSPSGRPGLPRQQPASELAQARHDHQRRYTITRAELQRAPHRHQFTIPTKKTQRFRDLPLQQSQLLPTRARRHSERCRASTGRASPPKSLQRKPRTSVPSLRS